MFRSSFGRVASGWLLSVVALGSTSFSPTPAQAQSVPAVCVGLNTAHTNAVSTGTLAPPLRRRWALTLDGRASAPLIVNGRVYVLSAASYSAPLKLRSIDSASGQIVWEITVSTGGGWGALAYEGNTVMAQCADGQLRAYDALSGTSRWTASTSYGADAPPVARNGRVYVSAGNALQCYEVAGGRLLWSKAVRGSSRTAPAISDNNEVYVAYSCPQVYKFNGLDGTQIWRYGTDSCSGGGGSTPSLHNGRLYVREFASGSTTYRNGFVFDAATGADVGTINSAGLPAFNGDLSFTVYRGNSVGNGRINAVSTQTGAETWNWADGGNLSSPVVLNGRVYVGSSTGKLHALDPQSGALLWTTSVGAAVVTDSDYSNSSPFVGMAAGEDLLVVPAQNKLLAFEAYNGTDTIAPSGYVTSPSGQGFLRAFPGSVAGVAADNTGGVGLDRVEVGFYRQAGTPGTAASLTPEYYGGNSYGSWSTTPRYSPATLDNAGNWTLDTSYFDSYFDSGTYSIEVVTFDRAGNRGVKISPLRIDKTAPTVTLTSPRRYTNALSSLSGTVADNLGGSGVASMKVSLLRDDNCGTYSDCGAYWNGSAWISTAQVTAPPALDCSFFDGVWTCTAPLPPLASMPEKWYRVRPVATDAVGNRTDLNSIFNSFDFWLDKTAPTLSFGTPSPAPNALGWNNSPVLIPYSASDGAGVASASPGSPLQISAQGKNQTGTVVVTDVSGNVANFVSPAVNIDSLAPTSQIQITGPQQAGRTAYSGAVSIALSASDGPESPATSGVTGTFYSVDNGATQTYQTPFSIEGFGAHTLKFWSSDAAGNSETSQTRNISIAPPNSAPVASAQSVSTDEDSSKTIELGATDADGDALTYSVTRQPAHGTLSGTAPTLTYNPATNYFGGDSFGFKASDGSFESAAEVAISVAPVNDAPVATPQTLNGDEDTALDITLGGTDIEADALSFSVATQPKHGVLTGTAPNLTYTPNADYFGGDSFTFKANDGALDSVPATVSIGLRGSSDTPVALQDAFRVNEDETLSIPAPGVLINDSDPDGEALTAILVAQPQHGSLLLRADGSFLYTPDADWNGVDAFSYRASDGVLQSAITRVSIEVKPVNDAPRALAQSLTTNEDIAKSFTLAGDDADGDALSFSIVSPPKNGVLSSTVPALIYTPATNFSGSDSFTFQVSDGTLTSTATISIGVQSVNDAPGATPQNLTLDEDSAAQITLGGSDIEGDALSFSIASQPGHGTLSGVAPNLTYTPAANYFGADSFSFKASDGAASSDAATINLQIRPVNDAPSALAQGVSTLEDTAKTILLSGNDGDGDALNFSIVSPPKNGVLSGTAPNLTYTPNANWNGSDSFVFKVSDGTLESAPATVSLAVDAVNDAPVASAQSVSTAQGTAKAITLGGSDVEGSALLFSVVSPPANGTLSGTAPNLIYTPKALFSGSDSFSFRVSDGALSSATATVSIEVTPQLALPVAAAKSATTPEDQAVTVALSGTASGGASVNNWQVVTNPQNGTLSGGGSSRTYLPTANFFGSDTFTYRVQDSRGNWSAPATVSLTVTPVNDAPSFNLPATLTTTKNDNAQTIAGFASAISPGPGETTQSVTFTVTNSQSSLFSVQPALSASGTLTFQVAKGRTGSVTVQVQLKDNGGTASGGIDFSQPKNFTITVK